MHPDSNEFQNQSQASQASITIPAPQITLDELLFYASKGYPVFPVFEMINGPDGRPVCSCPLGHKCKSPGKHPRTRNGFNDASTNPETIRRWFEKHPGCNWARVTGIAETIVIDIDPRNYGDKTWEALTDEHGNPETLTVSTGGGGEHRYFKYSGPKLGAKLGPGVDIKGEDGYVLLPGSNHKSGKRYEFLDGNMDEVEIADLPQWVIDEAVRVNGKQCGDRHDAIIEEKSAHEISAMLGYLPVERPDYEPWLQVIAAVCSATDPQTAEKLLKRWQPEEKPGEYAAKIAEINRKRADGSGTYWGFGTLVWLAKENAKKNGLPFSAPASVKLAEVVAPLSEDAATKGTGTETVVSGPLMEAKDTNPDVKEDYEKWTIDALSAPIKKAIATTRESDGEQVLLKHKEGYFETIRPQRLQRLVSRTYRKFSDYKVGQIVKHALLGCREVEVHPPSNGDTKPKSIIGFTNGVFDLDEDRFRPYRDDDVVINPPHAYQPELGHSAVFENALRDWMPAGNSRKDRDQILMMLAYLTLIPHRDYQLWCNFYGTGSNGKTVLLDILAKIVGEERGMAAINLGTMNNFTMASFENKRLVIGRDSPSRVDAEAGALLKELTDSQFITVEHKHKDSYQARNTVKVVVSTNEQIITSDRSDGFFRRVVVLPFLNKFPVNREFKFKLLKELPQIQNMLVDAARALHKQGRLDPRQDLPDFAVSATDELIAQNDPFRVWWERTGKPGIIESFKATRKGWRISEICAKYNEWCSKYAPSARLIKPNVFTRANQEFDRIIKPDGFAHKKSKEANMIVPTGETINGGGWITNQATSTQSPPLGSTSQIGIDADLVEDGGFFEEKREKDLEEDLDSRTSKVFSGPLTSNPPPSASDGAFGGGDWDFTQSEPPQPPTDAQVNEAFNRAKGTRENFRPTASAVNEILTEMGCTVASGNQYWIAVRQNEPAPWDITPPDDE